MYLYLYLYIYLSIYVYLSISISIGRCIYISIWQKRPSNMRQKRPGNLDVLQKRPGNLDVLIIGRCRDEGGGSWRCGRRQRCVA